MPNGPLFEAKNIADSNFRQLLRGFAGELFTAEGYLITLEQEYFPDTTTLFLSEWESALGIPDDCFSGAGTNNERRRDILVKLSSLGIQTDTDFVDLAAIFDKVVTVTQLSDEVFPPYSVPFTPSSLLNARFIIVITGENLVTVGPPYDVPFDVVGGETIMECLFNKLKPTNCNILFRNSN